MINAATFNHIQNLLDEMRDLDNQSIRAHHNDFSKHNQIHREWVKLFGPNEQILNDFTKDEPLYN